MQQVQSFNLMEKTVPLVVTGVAAAVHPIFGNGRTLIGVGTVRIANIGTQVAFLKFGGSDVVAALDDGLPMIPNSVETFSIDQGAYLSAIAAAAGSTLYITPGEGS